MFLIKYSDFVRSKDIEESSGNGDMAFQAVRIQQSVIEFILNHTEQIFSSDSVQIKPKEGDIQKIQADNSVADWSSYPTC